MPPILVYDDDCGFCTRSALWVGERSEVVLVGFSELPDDLRTRLPANWRDCAHLVTDDGVSSCGEAMERAFELTGQLGSGLLPSLRKLPGYAAVREVGYRWIANNRPLVSRVTRRFF